jgi:hypothetical protein
MWIFRKGITMHKNQFINLLSRLLTGLAFVFFLFSFAASQTNWTRYPGNPILTPGPSGSWEYSIQHASIVFDGNIYHMYYSGESTAPSYDGAVGHATSPDGIVWTKDTLNNPVLTKGSVGSWDSDYIFSPSVLYDGTIFHMWYTAARPTNANIRIGYATSLDGVIWEKYNDPATTGTLYAESDPVLIPGSSGSWDDRTVEVPAVILESGSYIMWYRGMDYAFNEGIGRATSTDGINWTKEPPNPVLTPDPSGTWENDFLRLGSVVYDGTTYHMFYYAGVFYVDFRIGYAWSSDGLSWTKYDDSTTPNPPFALSDPVLSWGSAGSWDDTQVGAPWVILDTLTSTFKMWYTGADVSVTGIGYATSPVILNVPGNYPTIQAAIDAASDSNIVLVDTGTYYENINFRGKAITVASRFLIDGDSSHITNTIINGSQPANPDSGSVVYFMNSEDTTSVLCGFTITGGTGTYYDASPTGVYWRAGGGIYCLDVTGVKIKNNRITGNRISGEGAFGGGIAVNASQGFLILEGNHIFANHASASLDNGRGGGAIILSDMSRIIGNVFERDTVISANYAIGGAIDVWTGGAFPADGVIQDNIFRNNVSQSTGGPNSIGAVNLGWTGPITVSRNLFEGNLAINSSNYAQGGALLVEDNNFPQHGRKLIVDNRFIGNMTISQGTATGGAVELFRTSATLDGNRFADNSVEGGSTAYGGAIAIDRSSFRFENNLVYRNTAPIGAAVDVAGPPDIGSGQSIINSTISGNTGVAISLFNTDLVLLNTIVWNNSGGAFQNSGGTLNVNYSDVQGAGVWPGTGNINADPLFADTIYYELSEYSPCIFAGIDSININEVWYQAPPFDFDGDPRPMPMGTPPDMGAQEFPYFTGIYEESEIPEEFHLSQNYPNPFNPSTTIEFDLPKTSETTLKIFNVLGEEVVTLVSEKLPAGSYSYDWDANQLASGVYLYRLQAGDYVETRKMVLMR